MGLPMAANLVAAGHAVLGLDLDQAQVEKAAAAGVRPAATLGELVAGADVLVTMLRTGAQTEALLLGADGLAPLVARDVDVVVMSTMDPPTMQRLAEQAAGHGMTVLDVPVSGGVRG